MMYPLMKKLQEIVDHYYKHDFDYDEEYWESSNKDDIFAYGVETGTNQMAELLHMVVETIKSWGDVNNVAV